MSRLLRPLLFLGGISSDGSSAAAFAPNRLEIGVAPVAKATTIGASKKLWSPNQMPLRTTPTLFESNNDDESTNDDNVSSSSPRIDATSADTTDNESLFQRFLSPRIDDPGLPLTDVLLAQIVAPTFQIYWLVLNRAPNPTWLQPISSYFGEAPELAPRGSLLAPTLIHGAGLAVCWLAGALAAKMYEREAFTLKETAAEANIRDGYPAESNGVSLLDSISRYDTIIVRLIQAGAFASGILILSTQLDLLLEFKRYIQYGESEETDLRILVGTVEVINDIFWEALVLSSWRIIHANFMSNPDNRLKRF